MVFWLMRAYSSSQEYRFSINLLIVYYIARMSTQHIILCDTLFFLLLYLNHIMCPPSESQLTSVHIMLHKTLSYHVHTLCVFTLLILWFICTFLRVNILLLLSSFGCFLYILLLSIMPSSFSANIQLSHIHCICNTLATAWNLQIVYQYEKQLLSCFICRLQYMQLNIIIEAF